VAESVTTGAESTFTETVALLFVVTGSGSEAVTASVVPSVPATVGVRTTATVAFEPLASEPKEQVNGDVPEQDP